MDRANVGPVASQVAGFCGAFLGAAAKRKKRPLPQPPAEETPAAEKNLDQSASITNLR